MADVRLTPEGDLYQQTSFVRGAEEVVQACVIRVRRFEGEWLLDRSKGMPYLDWFEEKDTTLNATVVDVMRMELEEVRGVEAVNRLTAELNDNRRFVVEADIVVRDADGSTVRASITSQTGTVRVRLFGGAF